MKTLKTIIGTIALLSVSLTSVFADDTPLKIEQALPPGKYLLITSTKLNNPATGAPRLSSSNVTVTLKDGKEFFEFDDSISGQKFEILYRNMGVMIILPPPQDPKYSFYANIYSGTVDKSKPGFISGRFWYISGWGDEAEEGYFRLVPAQK